MTIKIATNWIAGEFRFENPDFMFYQTTQIHNEYVPNHTERYSLSDKIIQIPRDGIIDSSGSE